MKSNLNSLIAKADHCLSKGRTEVAVKTYMSVLKLLPTHPVVNTRLGTLSLINGDAKEAMAYFEIALKVDPNNVNHWANLILAYSKSGDEALTSSTIERASITLSGDQYQLLLNSLVSLPWIKTE